MNEEQYMKLINALATEILIDEGFTMSFITWMNKRLAPPYCRACRMAADRVIVKQRMEEQLQKAS